jgi:hypothetical protein
MSQQAAVGHRALALGKGGRIPHFYKGWDPLRKGRGFISSISKIKDNTFNMGQNQFAAQLT